MVEVQENNKALVVEINEEINTQFADEGAVKALLATVFKKMSLVTMKQAVMEGMLRGFTFKDFLEKNVYAIPFGNTYSLVTSIDNSRKIGMKSGIVGKSAPIYKDDDDGKIISCSITVKRKVDDYVGEFTSEVYFDEYNKKDRDLWKNKPRTMIAKVAEMHALRMACPEELSQDYIEEEMVYHEGVSAKVNKKIKDSGLQVGKLLKDQDAKKEEEDVEETQTAEGKTIEA